ncbi:TetR/AcrR family transcriptional regulator [Photobacterium alginatilyticum]|uniref:TetR/AcrR family transcriptional regulator n=1 Tax=Photobacterium alginatilyticum TaxID=1775171 RepID=UPI004067FF35
MDYYSFICLVETMPRVSQAVARQTRQRIIDSAMALLLTEGYEVLTFSRLAKEANISRSGINAHFKRKEDLLEVMGSLVSDKIRMLINYSSPRAFYNAWVHEIDHNREFRLLINSAHLFASRDKGIADLKRSIVGNKREVDMYINMAIGYAMLNIDPK